MTKFADDSRPEYDNVTGVASPLGGTINFSAELNHREVNSGWQTWSNRYKGDVYYLNSGTTVTLTLPTATTAFYFYAEPQSFDDFKIKASVGSTLLSQVVDGLYGAEFFGFYTTGTETFSSITISTSDRTGFAIGEFGIAAPRATPVPEPSTYALVGAAALCGLIVVRRFKGKAS